MRKKAHSHPLIFDRIDQKLKRFLVVSTGQKQALEKLTEQALIEASYNSCALAGNSLTLSQTKKILQEKRSVGGKPVVEILDIQHYFETLVQLSVLAGSKNQPKLSSGLLDNMYKSIVRTIPLGDGLIYRTSDFTKTTPIRKLPDVKMLTKLIRSYGDEVRARQKKAHPIELAAFAHHAFLAIHPYIDANGRVGRALTHYLWCQKGYPPVAMLYNDRKRYSTALKKADKGSLEPLISLFAQSMERTLDTFLRAMEPPTPGLHEFYLPLSRIAQRFPYSKKYLNLLIRTGQLEAYKKGRNWVTSVEAVKRYIDHRKRNRNIYP